MEFLKYFFNCFSQRNAKFLHTNIYFCHKNFNFSQRNFNIFEFITENTIICVSSANLAMWLPDWAIFEVPTSSNLPIWIQIFFGLRPIWDIVILDDVPNLNKDEIYFLDGGKRIAMDEDNDDKNDSNKKWLDLHC